MSNPIFIPFRLWWRDVLQCRFHELETNLVRIIQGGAKVGLQL